VLVQIDPKMQRQVYQHGHPGPMLAIDPNRGEFSMIPPWLESCHEAEDKAAAGRH
jgi:hypothetical protein